jgi:hypothetical protein
MNTDIPHAAPIAPPPVKVPNDPGQAAIENLGASRAHLEDAGKLSTFGQFVGIWDMDIKLFDRSHRVVYHQPGVWMFSWILDGRAIQDVLVCPPRPASKNVQRGVGTTVRFFDEAKDLWKITYMSPTSATYVQLEGGARGASIILEGRDMDGSRLRWTFTEITAKLFQWTGFSSPDDGKNWWVEQEMSASRRL